MKQIERIIWILLVGILSGFLANTMLLSKKHNTPSNNGEDSSSPSDTTLIKMALTYLNKYYIDTDSLDYTKLMYGAISGIYESTGDAYTSIFPPDVFNSLTSNISGQIAGIGVYLQKKNNNIFVLSLVPNSPAISSGLKIGDQLLSVNQIPISNFSIEEVSERIQGQINSTVVLEVFRPSSKSVSTIKIRRSQLSVPSIYTQYLPDHIQYIKVLDFQDDTLTELTHILDTNPVNYSTGLILDLRNNPGGQLDVSCNIASIFLTPGKVIASTQEKNKNDNQIFYAQQGDFLFPQNIPIIVLVNEQTASAAEILAAALQENHRAVLLGRKTFGKGSIQSIFPVKYKGQTFGIKLTVAHYLTPNKNIVNKKGIIPDIIVQNKPISELEQATIDEVINNNMLPSRVGKNYEKKPTPEILQLLDYDLSKKHLYLRHNLLLQIIKEQKNLAQGNIYGVDPSFDTQLSQAINYLNTERAKHS